MNKIGDIYIKQSEMTTLNDSVYQVVEVAHDGIAVLKKIGEFIPCTRGIIKNA